MNQLNNFSNFPTALKKLVSHEVPALGLVRRVSDGDTIVVFMDRRFYDSSVIRLRLRGINSPELSTPEGVAAKAFLETILPTGMPVVVTTYKSTYDRFEAEILFEYEKRICNLAEIIVSNGYASFVA